MIEFKEVNRENNAGNEIDIDKNHETISTYLTMEKRGEL